MQLLRRVVLVCLALLCATAFADHAIGGSFTSLGSRRASNVNVYNFGEEPSWIDVQAPVDRFQPTAVQHVALSPAGDLFWVGPNNAIERYSIVRVDEAITNPSYRWRMGGQGGTFYGNIEAIGVSSGVDTLYVCGAFTFIGAFETADAGSRVYALPIGANGYDLDTADDISPPDTPVNCDYFKVLEDGSLIVQNNLGELVQAQPGSDSWSAITAAGGWFIGLDPLGEPLIRSTAAGEIFVYGTSVDGTPYTGAQQTIQKFGSATSWSEFVPVASMDNYTVTDFVIGNGNVYVTTASGNFAGDENYVFSATEGQTLGKVAGDWTFSSTNAINDLAFFGIHWDPNLQTLVAYGPDLNYVVFAPRSQRSEAENYLTFYAKAAPKVVQLTPEGSAWAPVYGGGFDDAPALIRSIEGATFFFANGGFLYDHYTGPIATYDEDEEHFGAVADSIGDNAWTIIDSDPAIGGVGVVNAVYRDDDLGLIVAGAFRTLNGAQTVVNSITAFGGELGSALGSGNDAGVRKSDINNVDYTLFQAGTINAVYVHDGWVYVGGDFDVAGSVSVNNVARFSSETGAWEDLVGGVNGVVYAITEFDGKIVFGGSFDHAGSTTRANNVAAYDPDDNEWEVYNQGVDGPVYAFAKYQGDLLAAGSFASASGKDVKGPSIAYWDEKNWHAINEKFDDLDEVDDCTDRTCTGTAGDVFDLFTWHDDVFFVSGGSVGSFNDDGYFPGTFVSGVAVGAGPDTHPLIEAVDAEEDCPEVLAAFNAGATNSDGSNRADISVDHRNLRYTWNGVNGNVKSTWPKKH